MLKQQQMRKFFRRDSRPRRDANERSPRRTFAVLRATAFAVAAYFRYRGEIGVGEVFYGIWARTGVFCVVALAFVVAGEPSAARTGLKALLIAYFATAPLHLAAIFPTDERRLKRWKKRAKKNEDNE